MAVILRTQKGSELTHVEMDGNFLDLDGRVSNLAQNQFSGNYADLVGKPTIPADVSDLTDTTNLLVGFSGDYNDLTNKPIIFSGDYDDLTSKPTIPSLDGYATETYVDNAVDAVVTFDGDYNSLTNLPTLFDGEFSSLTNTPTTLVGYGITDAFSGSWNDLTDTPLIFDGSFTSLSNTPDTLAGYGILDAVSQAGSIITGPLDAPTVASHQLRFEYPNQAAFPDATTYHGAIAHSHADGAMFFAHAGSWNQLANNADVPTVLTDLGITDGSIGHVLTTNGSGGFTFQAIPDTVGNFTLAASIIDTDDSSQISIVPAVVMNSDLTVQNNLTVDNNITCDTISVSSIETTGTGAPEIYSESDIALTATTRVTVTQSPFKLASFSDAERGALTAENGDMIYNTDQHRVEVYANGGWYSLDMTPVV